MTAATQELTWQRTDGAIPTWELITDPMLYVEKWGLGSWAAYNGEVSIGEPGTYGSRDEAQEAAEAEFRREHPVDTRDGFTCDACGGQVTTGDAGLRHLEA